MCFRKPYKNEKCGMCNEKADSITYLTAGSMTGYCSKCIKIAEINLINQCPHHYLNSFEEYKEWKRKHEKI